MKPRQHDAYLMFILKDFKMGCTESLRRSILSSPPRNKFLAFRCLKLKRLLTEKKKAPHLLLNSYRNFLPRWLALQFPIRMLSKPQRGTMRLLSYNMFTAFNRHLADKPHTKSSKFTELTFDPQRGNLRELYLTAPVARKLQWIFGWPSSPRAQRGTWVSGSSSTSSSFAHPPIGKCPKWGSGTETGPSSCGRSQATIIHDSLWTSAQWASLFFFFFCHHRSVHRSRNESYELAV